MYDDDEKDRNRACASLSRGVNEPERGRERAKEIQCVKKRSCKGKQNGD